MWPITSARRSHLVGGCAVEDIQMRQSGSEVRAVHQVLASAHLQRDDAGGVGELLVRARS